MQDCAILYLHGGGWVMGSCATERALAARIAFASATRVLSVDYRLAPEHPFPARAQGRHRGLSLAAGSRLRASSCGSGRHLGGWGLFVSLLVALRDAGDPLPAAAALISPGADLAGTRESIRAQAKADPMLDDEILLSDAERLAERARAAGVDFTLEV